MNSRRWTTLLVAVFLTSAAVLYLVRWLIFGQANEMFRFLLGDVAFLLIQVPLVTLIIDRLLQRRERDAMLQKLNMVIGAFYSQVGTELMGRIASCDSDFADVRPELIVSPTWSPADFQRAKAALQGFDFRIEIGLCDLGGLKTLLVTEKPFLLALLGNPNLLEHETFTELLWAVFHLAEELEFRRDLTALPETDARHIAGDIDRAYRLLVAEWLDYMRHLQSAYPYLFSLAIRTNPLDPDAEITVRA